MNHFIALIVRDAGSHHLPLPPCVGNAQKIALNGANCGKIAIDQIRELDPNTKTNSRTKAIEDYVFTNLGGGFANGGSLGGAKGSFGGPIGAPIGAALGASAGSITEQLHVLLSKRHFFVL